MDIKQLKTFIKVYETRNLTLAAEVLELSQPAVSSIIKNIESEFGLSLFIRNGKSIIPNDFAEKLYYIAKNIEFSEKLSRLELKNNSSITKTITVVASTYCDIFYRLIGEYSKLHPDVCFAFQSEYSLPLDHTDSCSDIMLLPDSDTENAHSLMIDMIRDLYAIFPNDNPFAKREFLSLYDLKDEAFVFIRSRTGEKYESCYSECINAGFTPNVSIGVDISATKYSEISRGYGIGLIYNTHLGVVQRLKGVTVRHIGRLSNPRGVSIAWYDEHLTDASRDFIEFVKDFKAGKVRIEMRGGN